MGLVFDNRTDTPGQPGLHVLIAGVSAYAYLPRGDEEVDPRSFKLKQLSCTAFSAYKVFRWIIDHQRNFSVPLATIRLLLSPNQEEIDAEPALGGLGVRCTLDNFIDAAAAWRTDAASNLENMTIFYFAGHGAQRAPGDGVLLMEDFCRNPDVPLRHAVDIFNIFNGMVESDTFPYMAQTQLYFVDACRDFLSAFRNYVQDDTSPVFRNPLTGKDRRSAPIFFATVPGERAYAVIGEQTVFSKALLDCLNNDAGNYREEDGEDRWVVSVHSLGEKLDEILEGLSNKGKDYKVGTGGYFKNTVISYFEKPPMVQISLEVDPKEALQVTNVQVFNEWGVQDTSIPSPLDPHPYQSTWPAGFYTIQVEIIGPDDQYHGVPGRPRLLKPPRYERKLRVAT
jgi:hypothetical protein